MMFRFWRFWMVLTGVMMPLSAFAAISVAAPPAALPRKAPPQGMKEVPSGGAGRILTSRMSGTRSARKMLMGLRLAVVGYFDSRPIIATALADRADQNLQATFTAKLKGVPLRGIMAIQMSGETGQGTLIFDRDSAFRRSFPALIRQINAAPAAQGRNRAPAPVRLTMTPLLDGSGQVGLPPGWQLTGSYKGTLDARGPQGELMALGGYVVVASPQAAGSTQGLPIVNFDDPVRAALDLSAFEAQKARMQGQPETRVTKIWDTKPAESQTGRAAYIRFSALAGGRAYEGLGLYSISPVDQSQGVLYLSVLLAPTPVFSKSLPAMVAAWQSWGIKDAVFRERMNSALASMKATSEILSGVNASRQESYARVNSGWSQYLRDEAVWKDPATERRYTGSTQVFSHNLRIGNLEPVPLAEHGKRTALLARNTRFSPATFGQPISSERTSYENSKFW